MDTNGTHVARCAGAALAFASALLIAACGGGGDDATAPAPQGPPGALDASFGVGGTVVTSAGTNAVASAVAIQTDNKIVAAGYAIVVGQKQFLLVRYSPDGTLDSAFGTGGKVLTAPSSGDSDGRGIALQPDGKIVVAGFLDQAGGGRALVRYANNGAIDGSFGSSGIVLAHVGDAGAACLAVALQLDGKVLVPYSTFEGAIGIMRFNADGTPDNSFGTHGETVLRFPNMAAATSIAIRPDGRILVAGSWWSYVDYFNRVGESIIARLDSAGVIDPAFGHDGLVRVPLVDFSPSIAVQADSKIVALIGDGVFRYRADGTLDSGFGVGGRVSGVSGQLVALQVTDKVVVAGYGVGTGFKLTRIDTNGVVDSAFGTGGSVDTLIGTSSAAVAAAIQPDGRIVAAGNAVTTAGVLNVAIARYFGGP